MKKMGKFLGSSGFKQVQSDDDKSNSFLSSTLL